MNSNTGVAISPKKGKFVKKCIDKDKVEEVKCHINSFPRVESHYCRANTRKQYLESHLTIRKMYNLYKEQCSTSPVKESMYRKVFNESFNLSFHIPKKDYCNICAEYEKKNTTLTKTEELKFENHKQNKILAKVERDKDRKTSDKNTAVICFDLQNVFSLPKAEVSNFFYKRKFSVYNLTGHCNMNSTTYCSVWTEKNSGRTGNDIASSLNKILKNALMDNPTIKHIILWSDSCVPQNKNRVISLMILKFLESHPNIISIEHKYSETGHSQIQEVDAVHSAIERHLKGISIYSPVSLLRQLNKMNYAKDNLKISQMQNEDFLNYNIASNNLNFHIPYTKVKSMRYTSTDLAAIECKTSFLEDYQSFQIFDQKRRRRIDCLPKVPRSRYVANISNEKKKTFFL